MTHVTINRDLPEESIPSEHSVAPQADRGVAGYRCKLYKALLHITSDSDYTKRPLVDRTGRWISQTHRA